MTIRKTLLLALLVSASLSLGAAEDSSEAQVEFSEAEVSLWMTDQLAAVQAPVTMTYTFERSGSLEPGFTDQVTFRIEKINADGSKAASLAFFTGERNFPVPAAPSTVVNPIFKVFLQGDVYEMNRLSDPEGTSRERWRYFQRRIKFALAESAEVKPLTFEFSGQQWTGREITFTPYINDPKRNLFETYADKRYTFIVCDDLPGYLYRIETVVPGADPDQPLLREVLQLTKIDRGGA